MQQGAQPVTDISQLRPQLRQEWHPQNNHSFGKVQLNPFSFRKATWRCPKCQNEWEDRIIDRACSEAGCQRCASNTNCADSKLSFMSQWNYRCNEAEGIFPEQVAITSSQRVWWICRKCPQKWAHEFQLSPLERTRRPHSCCPQCEGRKACICNDAPRGGRSFSP